MDNFASASRSLAEMFRYSGDTLRSSSEGDVSEAKRAQGRFYQDGLLVSPSVTPDLSIRLDLVCQRLRIPASAVEAFVYASPDIQAECLAGSSSSCAIRFSSSLIDLLNGEEFEFVVGHELGHFLLNHGITRFENQNESLEYVIENRAQEISADRLGLIACQSLETAIRALMKTVSGLSSEHLRFDVGAFISQLRNAPGAIRIESSLATHPSILIRCRALLWFSLSDALTCDAEHFSHVQLAKLDKRIKTDMDKFVDGPARQMIADAKENLAIWVAANHAVQDGTFDKNEQRVIADMFGEVIVEKLKNFLSDVPASEVQEMVYERVKTSRAELERLAPLGFEEAVRDIQKEIELKLR